MSEEEDSEEADILPESFHLLLGYDNRLSGKRTDVAQPWHWEEVNVRLTRMRVAPKSSPLLPKVVKSKGVRFDKNNQRSKLDVHGLSHPPQPVKDLCQAISSLKRPRTNLSFELQSIDPLTQKYGIRIYPLRTTPFLPEDWSLSSMNKAVCDPNFTKQARLRSGVTLAYSVLQFYSTPWISSALEKDNIFFLERSETSTFTDIFLSRTLRRPDERDSESTPDLLRRTIRNQALYSLGILLIEIWYGETLQGLHRPEDGALDTGDPIKEFLAMSNTADRLLQDLHDQAGAKYTEAVRRCLRCEFGNLDCNLDNFQFQRAVYNGVVSRLQENLEFLYLDTSD